MYSMTSKRRIPQIQHSNLPYFVSYFPTGHIVYHLHLTLRLFFSRANSSCQPQHFACTPHPSMIVRVNTAPKKYEFDERECASSVRDETASETQNPSKALVNHASLSIQHAHSCGVQTRRVRSGHDDAKAVNSKTRYYRLSTHPTPYSSLGTTTLTCFLS